MIQGTDGNTHIKGDVNAILTEYAFLTLAITEEISEQIGVPEEEVENAMQIGIQALKLRRSGMTTKEIEEVLQVKIKGTK